MVDRQNIEDTLKRLGEATYSAADHSIQVETTRIANAGRMGSHAHNNGVTKAAQQAFTAGLADMVGKVRDFAGHAAPAYSGALVAAADALKARLVRAHESRLNAVAGKYITAREHHHEFMETFTKALDDAQADAVADLSNKLSDPVDALPFWRRPQVQDRAINFAMGIIAAVVTTYVLKKLGL
jgi:hypothetical protein